MSANAYRIDRASEEERSADRGRPGAAPSTNGAQVTPRHRWYLPLKTATDYVLAVSLLPFALPVIGLAAVAIKLTSRGSVFYCQERLGKDGRPFTLIKLRTMVENAEAETGPVWARENDPRVTRVGRFLRESHLDELPQLLNVLAGHLSLVGPRPERPEFVSRLEWKIPYYTQRTNIRPGITGLAQLKLPPDSDTDSVRKKLAFDLYYLRYMTPWLDCRILVATAWCFFRATVRAFWRLIALPDGDRVRERLVEILDQDDPTLLLRD
ncbi:MAG: hypothetical protein GXP27_16500, partial [Planctomycetes bacterium]|nr:hypothetical protein [Planctomycetota bacterium]